MKSQKYIGLLGMIFSAIAVFVEFGYKQSISIELFITFMILTLYLGMLCWQYTIYGDWKKSVLPALKITLIAGIICALIGLLKRFN